MGVTVQHPVTRNQGYGDTLALKGGDSHVSETQRQGNRAGALTWVAGVDGEGGGRLQTYPLLSPSHTLARHTAEGKWGPGWSPAVPGVYMERRRSREEESRFGDASQRYHHSVGGHTGFSGAASSRHQNISSRWLMDLRRLCSSQAWLVNPHKCWSSWYCHRYLQSGETKAERERG